MIRATIPLALLLASFCLPAGTAAAHTVDEDYRSQWRVSCMIRHDKFDYVLPDGGKIGNTERVIQRGDILQIDWGADRNNFTTDIKRFAYVLREGETAPKSDAWSPGSAISEPAKHRGTTNTQGSLHTLFS